MKRAGWAAVGVAALVGAGAFVSWHRVRAPRPAPAEARLPIGWTVDHRTAEEFQRPREILMAAPTPPEDPVERRLCAAGLREKARTDPAFFEQLLRDLRDPSIPREYREMAALVLGTIDDPLVQHALVAELQSSRDTGWTIVLLHALGAEKASEDDEIFDLPDRPLVYTVAGLSVCVQTVLADDLVRRAVTVFLSDADPEVRRAAARTLVHSAEFPDLRQTFLQNLNTESDDGVRSGYARALADWTSRQALAEAERRQVMSSLLEAAARPEEAALRTRLEAPFRATVLLPREEEAFVDLALRGTPEQQIWSLSLLKGRELHDPDRVESACVQLTSPAADAKVREHAATLLGNHATASSTARLLEVLHDPEWNVRCAAARSLTGRMEARIALESTAALDPDERVRRAASGAMK